jgi:hypothetical protein
MKNRFLTLFALMAFIGGGAWAQSCPRDFTYDRQSASCVGKGGQSAPLYDCPGQPGYTRVFKEGSSSETTCTNADILPMGDSCPAGYYHTAIAQPPYNDICVGTHPLPQNLTPAQKREAIAEHEQKVCDQLPPNKWKVTATGADKTTL